LDKKREIIQASFDLFCEKGYHLSVSELARAVGIKTPSLCSHFESKDQILELMIHEEIHRYFSCLAESMIQAERLNCREAMKSLFLFVMDYFSDYKRLRFWRTIPLIPNDQLKITCSRLIAENDTLYSQKMSRCFARGIENGEIRHDVSDSALYLYLCMIQGVMDGMLLYPKGVGENAFAVKVFEAYWAGICV
jgi:AcrR family transcriptional regulator